MVFVKDIISTIEQFAPPCLQEGYDNTGLQLGDRNAECVGVLLCVDVTPGIIEEAIEKRCNLIVSHHPLLFKGLKSITGATPVEQSVMKAIAAGVAIYSCHTSIDNATHGVSWVMAQKMQLKGVRVLEPQTDDANTGLGAVGVYETPITVSELVKRVKEVFSSPVVRCTALPEDDFRIKTVAMCGGSGSFLLEKAVAENAQVFITSDTKYHDFVDYANRIFIVDIGHFESEQCTKEIFYHVIKEKFPTFALYYSDSEKNPINYL